MMHSIFIFLGCLLLGFGGFAILKACMSWALQRNVNRIFKDIESGKISTSSTARNFLFGIETDEMEARVVDLRSQNTAPLQISWSEVAKAVAFKRDLLVVDCICLVLVRRDDSSVEFDAEMKGWLEFCEALPLHLPGCRLFHEWLWPVASPAFATNATEIYSRHLTSQLLHA